MKVKKQLIIAIIILLIVLTLPTISSAGIESKPGGKVWKEISITDAYKVSYDLRGEASTLGKNSLDPHLTLNLDWGAVAYLGLSSYGAVKDSTGPTVTISGTSYTTTTGNPTGVMDFGKDFTWTSSIIAETTNDETNQEYRENLINALKYPATSKYVENLKQTANAEVTKSKGMALAETSGWYGSYHSWNSAYPCFLRKDICGYYGEVGSSKGVVLLRWFKSKRSI